MKVLQNVWYTAGGAGPMADDADRARFSHRPTNAATPAASRIDNASTPIDQVKKMCRARFLICLSSGVPMVGGLGGTGRG